jgi:hypothetical protein
MMISRTALGKERAWSLRNTLSSRNESMRIKDGPLNLSKFSIVTPLTNPLVFLMGFSGIK